MDCLYLGLGEIPDSDTKRRPSMKALKQIIKGMIVLLVFQILLSSCGAKDTTDQGGLLVLPNRVDFNFHIKPLLSDRCFKCHGPDNNTREANLRLDVAEIALKKKLETGGLAFIAGKPHKSQAYLRIMSTDPERQMPPPDAKLPLTAYEKALIFKWIKEGAEYKPHWSFVPPEKARLPKLEQPAWAKNEIDHFVSAKISEKGWSPSPEVDKATWLRRVSFDLTGLPPSLEHLDSFLADESLDAYEKQVDRLLASSAYGERMAIDWLDISRYADSHGYQDDGYRFVWPWRDWVISTFNRNMPYDQFITWQLAGDLLPNASREQRLATTFLRNHRINSEAGIVGEEYRVEYVADRTNTLGTAVLGLTLECARCHDHKYDPISQKDYYSLFSFFNNVNELGEIANDGNPGPLMMLSNDDVETKIVGLKEMIRRQETLLKSIQKRAPETVPVVPLNLQKDLLKGLVIHYDFEQVGAKKLPNLAQPNKPAKLQRSPSQVEGHFGKGLQIGQYDRVVVGEVGQFERTDPFSVSLWINPVQKDAYTPVWGDPSNKNKDFKGFGLVLDHQQVSVRFIHALPHNHIHVSSLDTVPLQKWSHVVMSYDGSSRAAGITIYINGKRVERQIKYDNLYKGMKRIGMVLGGGTPWGTFDGGIVDEFRVYQRELSPLEVTHLYQPTTSLSAIPEAMLSAHELLHRNLDYQKGKKQLKELRVNLHQATDTIKEIMVMEEMAEPRATFVLQRGVYDAPGEEVSPRLPHFFGQNEEVNGRKDRRALAAWLMDRQHPLTARVAVNRLWKQCFGRGLVKSGMDFGNQGILPSHPKLLDWLAVDFMESDWNIKALLKKIVLSATYRQNSQLSETDRIDDPENIFLRRGPRFRLSAEAIRDNALQSSGLLVDKIGGAPVKPYQPPGLWKELAPIGNQLSRYKQDHGEKLYRRSLYTIWKRTAPPPALVAFDAPTRELCLVERQLTTTPLQSLVLWNDPQWLECARMIGEKMMKEPDDKTEAKIKLAFRLLTSRFPKAFELERLARFYEEQLAKYQVDKEAAVGLLTNGEFPRDETLDVPTLAACTMVAHTLMNLDEAIVRY